MTTNPNNKRICTTVVGITILVLAIAGIFYAGLQFIGVSTLDLSYIGLSQLAKSSLYGVIIVSVLPSLAMCLVGLFTILRQRWALVYLGLAAILSIVNLIWQLRVLIPAQLREAILDTQRFNLFVGLYTTYFVTFAIYLAIFVFLQLKNTRAEFAVCRK